MTDDTQSRAPELTGADLEISDTARMLSEALGVGGAQSDALRAALAAHATAVGSKSTAMIAGMFGPMFKMIEGARADIGTVARQQVEQQAAFEQLAKDVKADRKARQDGQYSLVKRYEELVDGTHKDREQLHSGQQQILSAVETLGARVGAVEVDLATFQKAQTEFNEVSLAHRAALETTTNLLQATVEEIQATVDRLPPSEQLKVVRELQQELADFKAQWQREWRPIKRVVLLLLGAFSIFVLLVLISLLVQR